MLLEKKKYFKFKACTYTTGHELWKIALLIWNTIKTLKPILLMEQKFLS